MGDRPRPGCSCCTQVGPADRSKLPLPPEQQAHPGQQDPAQGLLRPGIPCRGGHRPRRSVPRRALLGRSPLRRTGCSGVGPGSPDAPDDDPGVHRVPPGRQHHQRRRADRIRAVAPPWQECACRHGLRPAQALEPAPSSPHLLRPALSRTRRGANPRLAAGVFWSGDADTGRRPPGSLGPDFVVGHREANPPCRRPLPASGATDSRRHPPARRERRRLLTGSFQGRLSGHGHLHSRIRTRAKP